MPQTPFSDFYTVINSLPPCDTTMIELARKWQKDHRPSGFSLGALDRLAQWYSSWRGCYKPEIRNPILALFAGSHGIAHATDLPFDNQGVQQTINLFAKGLCPINQICMVNNLGLKLFELATSEPTHDIRIKPAMDEKAAAATMAFGMESIIGDIDLLCLGEMNPVSEIGALALCVALFGGDIDTWIDSKHKDCVECLQQALRTHAKLLHDPLQAMRCLTGREIAALVGAIIAARAESIPVILDGFAATAAAALLYKINPSTIEHCLIAQATPLKAQQKLLEIIKKPPLLHLEIEAGQGVGAALASTLLRSAVAAHTHTDFMQ